MTPPMILAAVAIVAVWLVVWAVVRGGARPRRWACADCKTEFTTEADLIAHERRHGYCPCGGDRVTGYGHHATCSQRLGLHR